MAKRSLISISFPSGNELEKRLKGLPAGTKRAVKRVVKRTTEKAFKRVKFKTPVARGFAGGAISKWKKRQAKGGRQGIISNKADHIRVLEFGGYPVRVSSGKVTFGGKKPGPKTQRARSGRPKMTSNVSRQAPQGMIRIVFKELEKDFAFDLGEELDRAMSGR